jgi:uncharacterized membrane-anchored protein
MSPTIIVALFGLVCVASFLMGLRFYRMTEEPGPTVSLEHAHRFGRLMMMAATAMLLFLVAVIIHGDLKLEALK